MYRFLRWYQEQNPVIKILLIIAFCLFLVATFVGVAACVGSFIYAIQSIIEEEPKTIWYYALQSPKGKPVTFISYAILLIITLVSFTVTYRNHVKTSDERGVHFMEDNTFGSSRWMQEEEVANAFAVSNIEDTTTTIYGQLTDEGEAVVGWKPNATGGTGNRNVIVLASMGSGKSFGYVRTELIQATLRGNSFVVTDPSAELYTDLAKFLKERGVDVKVLNLAEPQYSEFWNCLQEVIDPETERLDSTRLNDFADIFMTNASTKEEKKDFWYGSAQNLLKAVIGFTAYKYEEPIINSYISLYKEIMQMSDADNDRFTIQLKEEYVSFPYCRDIITKVALEKGIDIEALQKVFDDIKQYSSPENAFTISQVFNNTMKLGSLTEQLDKIPEWHPAKSSYLTYQTNDTDTVRKSALQSLQLKFQLFQDNKLKEILSHDGIELGSITKKQSAYFVIMSDKSQATKPIASLFFSFLFKDAQDVYDHEAQIAKEKGIENPCLDLVTMLDEFYSIGVIGGSPEAFGTTMSNSRKRHIYISIIVQVYSQIEDLYEEHIRDVIQGGCSTLLYLGGNDPSTCEFISEFASGESTVLAETHKQLTGVLNTGVPTDLTVRSEKRFLLTVDEARRWKNEVLVVKQGEFPLRLNPFPWIQHPLYVAGMIKPTSIYSNIEPLHKRLSDIREESLKISDPQTELHKEILQFSKSSIKVDPETGEIIEQKPIEVVSNDIWADDSEEANLAQKPAKEEKEKSKPATKPKKEESKPKPAKKPAEETADDFSEVEGKASSEDEPIGASSADDESFFDEEPAEKPEKKAPAPKKTKGGHRGSSTVKKEKVNSPLSE